jgi:hypothetical protein
MFRKNFNTAKTFRRHDSLQTLKVIYIFFLKKKNFLMKEKQNTFLLQNIKLVKHKTP